MEKLILYTLIAVAGIATLVVEAHEGISTATYGADVVSSSIHDVLLANISMSIVSVVSIDPALSSLIVSYYVV